PAQKGEDAADDGHNAARDRAEKTATRRVVSGNLFWHSCLERRRDIISALTRSKTWEWRNVAMLQRAVLVALIAVAAIPIAAQGPAGWKVRPDETNATLGVMPTEKGFQLTGGPGIFFKPPHPGEPLYHARATFH